MPDEHASPKMREELNRLKRVRSAKQGMLTRNINYFKSKQTELDIANLQHLMDTIDELHKKFEEVEEGIVMIDPEYDELSPDAEIPVSVAAIKFADEYNSLRIQILSLIQAKKKKEKAKQEEATVSKCRLPKLELPHFNGQLTDWTGFKNEFLSIVKDKSLTDVDRFRLLKSALDEGPRQVISNIEVTEENYEQAWEALTKRFENKGLTFRAHKNSIFSLQGASGANIEKYRELLEKSQAHYRAMLQMGNTENVAENLMISYLLTKLDAKCQQEWEDYTDDDISTWDEFTLFLEKYTSTMEKVEQTRKQI